jgi:CheY-like chemotaxis protein
MKPAKQSELFDAIVHALGVNSYEQPDVREGQDHSTPVCQPLRILLAEDNTINQKLALSMLRKQGHQVTLASTGREALDAFRRGDFEVILMDVQMPQMDGLEATEAIRRDEQRTGTHVPIIAMTAHAMKGDREWCLGAGMDDYLSKPIRAQQLNELLSNLFVKSPPHRPAAIPAEQGPNDQLVNWEEALEYAGGDREFLTTTVLPTFVRLAPDMLEEVRRAAAERQLKALERAAHTLKGAASSVACPEVTRAAEALEMSAAHADFDEVDRQLAALELGLEQLTAFLRRQLAAGAPV